MKRFHSNEMTTNQPNKRGRKPKQVLVTYENIHKNSFTELFQYYYEIVTFKSIQKSFLLIKTNIINHMSLEHCFFICILSMVKG